MAEQLAQPQPMTFEERKKGWIEISDLTEEEFDALRADQKARQVDVPQPGTEAPDFEIEIMDRKRKRTGESVRLSSLRGKPVGLIFGSWT